MDAAEYDTMARVEDRYWWYRNLRRRIARSLRDAVATTPRRILDVGCGTGANVRGLRTVFPGCVVVGSDVAAQALEHARVRFHGPLVQASANALPFRDGVFDVVLITDVLNVAAVDDAVAVHEAHRVLRAHGVLAINRSEERRVGKECRL